MVALLGDLSSKRKKTPYHEPELAKKPHSAPPMPAGGQRVNNSQDELRVLQAKLHLVKQVEAMNHSSDNNEEHNSHVFVALLVLGSLSSLVGLGLWLKLQFCHTSN